MPDGQFYRLSPGKPLFNQHKTMRKKIKNFTKTVKAF